MHHFRDRIYRGASVSREILRDTPISVRTLTRHDNFGKDANNFGRVANETRQFL
jgi:hypothetical protein